jgi:2-dehydro-3-deoxyphosphogluconate aldolase/(4S)-4-hydroxy-2-oxoglutarate aldolase
VEQSLSRFDALGICDAGIVAIIRAGAGADLLGAARALARGGVRVLEITLNTPGALPAIERARRELSVDGVRVGAGTILSDGDAQAAIDAGAEFVVTPTLQPDSIAVCKSRSVPILCGCASATEAVTAQTAGADFVKLFPAGQLGVRYARDLLAALPSLRLVPTGGVSIDNLARYIEIGCPAVAVGSQLVDGTMIKREDWNGLSERAGAFMITLARARSASASP